MLVEVLKQTGLYHSLEVDIINPEMICKRGETESRQMLQKFICKLEKPPAFTVVRVNTISTVRFKVEACLKETFPKHEVLPHPILPDVVVIHYLKEHPPPTPHGTEVIVSLKCGLSVLRGASVYTPGVLGAPKCMKKGDLVSVYCDIEGKCLRGATKHYAGCKYYLGNGVVQWNRRDLFVTQYASGIAIEMTEPVMMLPSLNGVYPSTIFLQNLPSIVCGHVLDPKPCEIILDMCAAPGGKCSHLGTLMNNEGVIIALDKTDAKLQSIKANAERLGLQCIYPFVFDSTKCLSENAPGPEHLMEIKGPPYSRETFDKVMLDAPCSCLGQRPQLTNKMTPQELSSYSKIQKKLLKNAVNLVKRGGTIVYSTCTFTVQENEANVKWVLEKFPHMKLAEQIPYLGEPGLFGAGLSDADLLKLQRFGLPSTENIVETDTIAFFIAKFVKE